MSDDCLWYSVTLALDILSLSVPSHPFFLFFFLPFVLFVPFVVIHSSFLPLSLSPSCSPWFHTVPSFTGDVRHNEGLANDCAFIGSRLRFLTIPERKEGMRGEQ